MKKLSAALLALSLAGCASAPRPQMMIMPHKAPIVKAAPAPAVAPAPTTPNQIVKKRWYDRFPKHPTWFHH